MGQLGSAKPDLHVGPSHTDWTCVHLGRSALSQGTGFAQAALETCVFVASDNPTLSLTPARGVSQAKAASTAQG